MSEKVKTWCHPHRKKTKITFEFLAGILGILGKDNGHITAINPDYEHNLLEIYFEDNCGGTAEGMEADPVNGYDLYFKHMEKIIKKQE
jgi:hypothetical protein